MKREIPLYTLEGVTGRGGHDALLLDRGRARAQHAAVQPRGRTTPARDSVMIVHGLTTSTDMFIMPEHYNLVSYLLDNGYTDVWCLDMRMSQPALVQPVPAPVHVRRHRAVRLSAGGRIIREHVGDAAACT